MTGDVLNHVIGRRPPAGHRISFVRLGGSESMDLQELHDTAGRLAGALARQGLRRGDRIGILAANGPEWVLLDLAALRLGAVTVGLAPDRFEPDPALLDRYGLSVLFTDHGAGTAGLRSTAEVRPLAAGAPPAAAPPARYAPGDVTTLKLTSGSTGKTKTLTASAGSTNASLTAVQQLFRHGPGDTLFVFLPLSLLQQRYWIYSALRFGHDVVVSTYEAAFPTMRRVRPTVVMGVPAFYESAKDYVVTRAGRGASRDALRSAARELFGHRVRYLWTGSAPAGSDVLRFLTDVGLPVFEGYGLNETCIVSKNHPGAYREGSVGKVLPGKQVLLGRDGAISVRSDVPVTDRYESAPPGESERVFVGDGVVRTGDLGHLDEDGFLFIRGRTDDVIVLGNGRKVVVRPIEEHLKTSSAIEECVLFSPDRTHLVAVVSPAREPADEPAIAAQLAATNAAFGRDEQIRRVVVARRFGSSRGLLTDQFKPRRRQILDTYFSEIHDGEGRRDAR